VENPNRGLLKIEAVGRKFAVQHKYAVARLARADPAGAECSHGEHALCDPVSGRFAHAATLLRK